MAAVRVLLPWSMCPIVPTFTCGLFRWKTSLAMGFLGVGRGQVARDLAGICRMQQGCLSWKEWTSRAASREAARDVLSWVWGVRVVVTARCEPRAGDCADGAADGA